MLRYLVKTGERQNQQWVLSLGGGGVDAKGSWYQFIVSKIVVDLKENLNHIGERPYLLVTFLL